MKYRLLKIALITSPLTALYGIMPIYLFDKISGEEALFFGAFITLNVLIFWFVNSFLVLKYGHLKSVYLYLISFLIIILSRAIIFTIKPDVFIDSYIFEIPMYPIVNVIVINIGIWGVIEFMRSIKRTDEMREKITKLSIENLEAKHQSIKKQLQPHFLFNALSTLKALINEDKNVAENYTVQLSEFLRFSFKNQDKNIITVKEELAFAQNYIELQKLRFENKFEFDISIEEAVLLKSVPVFSIQLLIENIFKHNYFTEKNKMEFTIKNDKDSINVWNKKTATKSTDKNNTGLKNLNKRYELIIGKNIQIEDNETYFSVSLPIIENENINN